MSQLKTNFNVIVGDHLDSGPLSSDDKRENEDKDSAEENKTKSFEALIAALPESKPSEHALLMPFIQTGKLSYYVNPAYFFVQPIDQLENLNQLQKYIQNISPSLPKLINLVKGARCCVLYSVDKIWYRANIVDVNLMAVQFVDFGKIVRVSDITDIKDCKLDLRFFTMPCALPCALPIRPQGIGNWVDAAHNIFYDSYSKVVHYQILTYGDFTSPNYVEIFIDKVDVSRKLIADGYAKFLQYVIGGSSCHISHVNNLSDFYIQSESDTKALESMEMYLRDAEQQLKPMECYEKGQIVAAKFEEDGLWYRAQLLGQLPDSRFEVLFIDYGKITTTSKCLQLSKEMANLPSLSTKCALQLPRYYEGSLARAEQKFAQLSGEKKLDFTVKLLKIGQDQAIIELILDDQNIWTRLMPHLYKPISYTYP